MDVIYVIQGWWNHFLFKLGMKDNPLWKERQAICNLCTWNINNTCSKKHCAIVNNKRVCGCGCPISKKIKSKKPCPLGRWK